MRRTGAPFFLGDTAFLSDGKFRALARRLPDPDDFNSAVGAFFIALAAARRNGDPDLDMAVETSSRFLEDLRAVGLVNGAGFFHEPFQAWAPMTPQQAAAGRARAKSAQRDDAGKFVPSSSNEANALAALDQRVQPSLPVPSLPILSPEEGVQGEKDSLDTYHALTGFRPWGQFSGDNLKTAMADYGDATVDATLRAQARMDGTRETLLKRTLTQLAKDADRQKDAARKPKPKPPPSEDVKAKRRAFLQEAYATKAGDEG